MNISYIIDLTQSACCISSGTRFTSASSCSRFINILTENIATKTGWIILLSNRINEPFFWVIKITGSKSKQSNSLGTVVTNNISIDKSWTKINTSHGCAIGNSATNFFGFGPNNLSEMIIIWWTQCQTILTIFSQFSVPTVNASIQSNI